MSTSENDNKEGFYVLPRNLEVSGIKKSYEEIKLATENKYEKFVIDAAEVALIDTAGIQLLVQMVKSLKSNGTDVSWVNDSIQIYQMSAELGLADELEG